MPTTGRWAVGRKPGNTSPWRNSKRTSFRNWRPKGLGGANPLGDKLVGSDMDETRFPADGIVGIIIWQREEGRSIPYIRLYEPRDPETGGYRGERGAPAKFKDYRMCNMTDPSIKIVDNHGAFEFVEREDGTRFFDFSLKALGKTQNEGS